MSYCALRRRLAERIFVSQTISTGSICFARRDQRGSLMRYQLVVISKSRNMQYVEFDDRGLPNEADHFGQNEANGPLVAAGRSPGSNG